MFKTKLAKILLTLTLLAGSIIPVTILNAASARDCNSNSVMYCGALSKNEFVHKLNTGDGQHSAAELKRVYNSWGINASTISDAKLGTVKKDGNIIVGGKIVATNARSVGREYMPGSQKDPRSGLWIRPTAVSFASSELSAFVEFDKNGEFAWAVIESCGNMVAARPKAPESSFQCLNLTARPDSGNAPLEVTFNAHGEAKNVKIQSYNFDFGDGTKAVVDTKADLAKSRHIYSVVGNYTATVRIKTDHGTTKVSQRCSSVVHVRQNAPEFACSNLSANPTQGQVPLTVNFTAAGTVSGGATITGYLYDFGDGVSSTSESNIATHTYTQIGDYTANVRIQTTSGTTPVVAVCQARIRVTEEGTPPPGVTPPGVTTTPATGPETTILGIFSISAMWLGIKKYLIGKRSLRNALITLSNR